VADLLLEFFPVVNIPEDSLLPIDNDIIIGGYYTIVGGKIFLKMPDLTGRNSAGYSSSVIAPTSLLYFEVNSGFISRVQLDKFVVPPMGFFLGNPELEFPGLAEGVTINISGNIAIQDGAKIYLSPTINDIDDFPYNDSKKPKFINGYNSSIEIFSFPTLTKGLDGVGGDRAPMIDPFKYSDFLNAANENAKKYIPSLLWQLYNFFPIKDFPFVKVDTRLFPEDDTLLSSLDPYAYFGIKNQSQIMITPEDEFFDKKNDEKYYNLSSHSKINILSSLMPKFSSNDNIPSTWISKSLSLNEDPRLDQSGDSKIFKADLSFLDFEGIDIEKLSGKINYNIYLADSYGQVTKVFGPNISLKVPGPTIDSINPNGFDGSGVIYSEDPNPISLNISGSGLDKVVGLTLGPDGVSPEDILNYAIIFSSNILILNLPAGFFKENFSGLTNRKFLLTVDCGVYGSASDYIYVTELASDQRPLKPIEVPDFDIDEFYPTDFKNGQMCGIPLFKDKNNATIKISSKSNLFKNNNKLYAYLGFPTDEDSILERIQYFSLREKIVPINFGNINLLVPVGINFTLSYLPTDDFYVINRKNAVLNFPGRRYSNYNFSSLHDLKNAYIIISKQNLNSLNANDNAVIEKGCSLVKIGKDDGTPAFIEPFSIVGIAAKDVSGKISSTFSRNLYPKDLYSNQFKEEFTVEAISISRKIKNMIIIVTGIEDSNLNSKYSFFIEDEDISSNICRKPVYLGGGRIMFEFKNIVPKTFGTLNISLKVKKSPYIRSYESKGYYSQGTAIFASGAENPGFRIDDSVFTNTKVIGGGRFTIETFIEDFLKNPSGELSGFIGLNRFETRVTDTLYPELSRDGAIFDDKNKDNSINKLLLPIDITPSVNLYLKSPEFSLIPQGTSKNIKGPILREFEYIPLLIQPGSSFSSDQYIRSSQNVRGSIVSLFLLFYNVYNYGFSSIKFNVPEIIKIARGQEEFKDITNSLVLVVREEYRLLVINSDKNVSILINGILLERIGRPEFDSTTGGYIITVKIPVELGTITVVDSIINIQTSIENITRNDAEIKLGESIIRAVSPPDCNKIRPGVEQGDYDKAKDVALRIIRTKIQVPFAIKNAIDSFCNLSFELTKELKYTLNGLENLMIPIQVIFCIIDVICSLLNPVKLASAIIRLFECLYDLVSMLPSVSVPVMFFSLGLHLLELFQCIFDKIAITISAINEILIAIYNAATPPFNFTELKALEETLERNLGDVDLDLKFLDPIVSILDILFQLLQLVFRFPCKISAAEGEPDCGVDGSILAGLVSSVAAPNSVINPEVIIPVAQAYSIDPDGDVDLLSSPVDGAVVATEGSETFFESMNVDEDSLRATASFPFSPTFAPCFTKSVKNGIKAGIVSFKFNYNCKTNTFKPKSKIDPNQSTDAPFALFRRSGNDLVVSEFGNMFSPIDGVSFLELSQNGNEASVKPLTLNMEIPITQIDPVTGELVQIGVENIPRTFDNIPMMAIMDDESNLYFIEKDGIKFNSDAFVDKIVSRMVNGSSAPKHKFSEESEEVDSEKVSNYEFPQIYFFDMRQIGEQLQQYCINSSINSFPLEDNNAEDIQDIVAAAQKCVVDWRTNISNIIERIRAEKLAGNINIQPIDINQYQQGNQAVVKCIEESVDRMCKFVINSLNTSFKVLEDYDETPNAEYVDGDVPDTILEGFNPSGPRFTGAREYAAGIGDSGVVESASYATLEIIPRDAYDIELDGDISSKITIEIISDETGGASFLRFDNGSTINYQGSGTYISRLTTNGVGWVKVRAKICDRVIQALTYQDLKKQTQEDPGCVPGLLELSTQSPPIGSLVKVDRVLSVYFKERAQVSSLDQNDLSSLALTEPQQFGTSMEN
jgi:hypothetical protein